MRRKIFITFLQRFYFLDGQISEFSYEKINKNSHECVDVNDETNSPTVFLTLHSYSLSVASCGTTSCEVLLTMLCLLCVHEMLGIG